MMNNMSIPIVIPAYEPDSNLIKLCNTLYDNKLKNIIIVDDGSGLKYRTIFNKIAEDYGYIILRHAINLGKGRALKTAFNYILNIEDTNIVGCITADSDGQHSIEDIKKCMFALQEHQNSLVMGCREFKGENIPFKSIFGNILTQKVFSFLCGMKISDTQTGLRGIPLNFMKVLLDVRGERFEFETNMLIEAKDRVSIYEVPIQTIYDSKQDHKTHFKPIKDSIKIYKIFISIFLRYIFSSGSSCVVDLVLFTIFCNFFRNRIGVSYIIVATIFARVISALYNYLINYTFVFKSSKKHSLSLFKYTCLAIMQMLLSGFLVTYIVTIFNFQVEIYIKICVDSFLFFCSYYIQKKYIF